MKKFYLFIMSALALVGMSAGAYAADGAANRLTFNLAGDTQTHFLFSEKPEMTFDADNVIVSASGATTTLPFSDINYFEFTEGTTALDAVLDNQSCSFAYIDGIARLSAASLTAADVFNAAGVKVLSAKAADGVITIDFNALAQGVYVIAAEGFQSIKIIR